MELIHCKKLWCRKNITFSSSIIQIKESIVTSFSFFCLPWLVGSEYFLFLIQVIIKVLQVERFKDNTFTDTGNFLIHAVM